MRLLNIHPERLERAPLQRVQDPLRHGRDLLVRPGEEAVQVPAR